MYCARRGAPLLLLMTVSSILIMPYFNQRKYVPISDGRYLMPLLPLAFAAIGALLAKKLPLPLREGWGPGNLPARGKAPGALDHRRCCCWCSIRSCHSPATSGRSSRRAARTSRCSRPSTPSSLPAAPASGSCSTATLRDLKLEGGGTAFRSLRFLLAGVDIDDRSVESAFDYGRGMSRGSSALLVMDARSYGRFGGTSERLRATGVDAQSVAVPPGSDGYGIYRLERPGAAASSAPIGPRGFPCECGVGFCA